MKDKIQINLEKDLKQDFKIATIKQGKEMTAVLKEFITDYVKKFA